MFTLAFIASLWLVASRPVHGTNVNLRPDNIAWQGAAINYRVTLQIGLKEGNIDEIHDQLRNVSDPQSPAYGQHWDRDRVEKLTTPSDSTHKAVRAWLRSQGFKTTWKSGSTYFVDTTIQDAKKHFNMSFDQTTINGVLRTRLMDGNYTTLNAPSEVRNNIDLIWPVTWPGREEIPDEETVGSEDAVMRYNWPGFYPNAADDLYNTSDYEPQAGLKSKLGFPSFQVESANRTRLFRQYNELPHRNFTRRFWDEFTSHDCGSLCVEATNLDEQGAITVAQSLPIVEYVYGGRSDPLPLLTFLLRLTERPNRDIPQVIFITYGVPEQKVSRAWALRACFMMGKLALRGITFVVASGDHGAGKCKADDGTNATMSDLSFPATCPWVTVVGAARRQLDGSQEAAGESGGGFSSIFGLPEWQGTIVDTYIDKQTGNGDVVYRGRGYPDVAATMSTNTSVFSWDAQRHYSGTPYAAPSFAALIALINDARLKKKKSVLGFLNPWLYQEGYRFLDDITEGSSTGYSNDCQGDQYSQPSNEEDLLAAAEDDTNVVPSYGPGWRADVGWDAATGLGTPDFGKMLDAAMALP